MIAVLLIAMAVVCLGFVVGDRVGEHIESHFDPPPPFVVTGPEPIDGVARGWCE